MCCLFGLIDYGIVFTAREKNRIIKVLSAECEVRGTDATGIAFNSENRLCIYKRPLAAHKLWYRIPENSKVIMGHTRMTTQGSEKYNFNNHPFQGHAGGHDFALAHNGVLHNDRELRITEHLPKTKIQTDSYVAVQLLEHYGEISIENVGKMAETVSGSFCFSILTDTKELYLVKGNNPLVIYDCGGYYIYASTADILNNTLKKLHIDKKNDIDIRFGEIFKISADGTIERGSFSNEVDDYPYYPYWGIYDAFSGYDTELDTLIRSAGYFGFEESDIIMLIDLGYDALEIEEMLYDPFSMREIISEYREIMV